MPSYWISCALFTCVVTVDDEGIIRKACPFLRRFIGQPLNNLKAWRRGHPLRVEEL